MPLALASLAALALSTGGFQEPTVSWSLELEVVESCCCDPICPCMVGSKPTRGYCRGNRLVQIEKGHYGDVRLDGVSFVVTFDLGKWTKLYFDEKTTDEEIAATRSVLGKVWRSLVANVLETAKVPLAVERTESAVAYSVPASRTEIQVMRGADDRPIRVENLRSFEEYTQFESVKVSHVDEDVKERSFEYAGTNGFTARFEASSDAEER